MINYPSKKMIEHLNLVLKSEGSSLQYIVNSMDGDVASYDLVVVDKYVNNEYKTVINVTKEFEDKVRNFFKEYNIENIGYTNTVLTIFAC